MSPPVTCHIEVTQLQGLRGGPARNLCWLRPVQSDGSGLQGVQGGHAWHPGQALGEDVAKGGAAVCCRAAWQASGAKNGPSRLFLSR